MMGPARPRAPRMMRSCLPPLLALLVWVPAADAKVTSKLTLVQLVQNMPVIFTAQVKEFLPDKPGMVLAPKDKLRGEFSFDRVPVNLTGDKEAAQEKQLPLLLERLEKEVTLLIFAAREENTFNAVGY